MENVSCLKLSRFCLNLIFKIRREKVYDLKIQVKYTILRIFLILLKGSSICFAPAHVSRMKEEAVIQNIIFFWGENFLDLFFIFFIDSGMRIIILITRAITPPNLFGIDRKIA